MYKSITFKSGLLTRLTPLFKNVVLEFSKQQIRKFDVLIFLKCHDGFLYFLNKNTICYTSLNIMKNYD